MPGFYTMKVITDFAAAHFLRGYEGKCARLHGHNWKVEVEVTATALDDLGMGLDFVDIKKAMNEVLGAMDHQNLNDLPPFDKVNPTAENLAAYVYSQMGKQLNDNRVRVSSITIWETDRACVRYNEVD